MPIKKVRTLLKRLSRTFVDAAIHHVEPVFNEAAEGDDGDGGGVKWHGKAPIGIPGAKFHAMTGQTENSNLVRQERAAGREYREQVLDRPDYYGSFEKCNKLQM